MKIRKTISKLDYLDHRQKVVNSLNRLDVSVLVYICKNFNLLTK